MKGAILWKRILNEGLQIPPDLIPPDDQGVPEGYVSGVEHKIITCPIILDPTVQPLGEYDYDWSKYVGLSIPFPNFWVEGRLSDMGYWGTKVTSIRLDPDLPIKNTPAGYEDGWFVQLFACMGGPGSPPWAIGKVFVWVDRDGNLMDAKNGKLYSTPAVSAWATHYVLPDGATIPLDCDPKIEFAKQTVQTACDVMRLLSCKNVSLKRNDGEPKDVRRAVKRHGGTPGRYRYHTLVVRPAGARSDSAAATEIGSMPRHVVRGHFAEYGEAFGKGLLFGKLAGRFFIPPHLKGNRENGIVEKDYAIPG